MKKLIISAAVIMSLASCANDVNVKTFDGQKLKVKNGWDIPVEEGDTIIVEQRGIYNRDYYIPNEPLAMKDTMIGVYRRDTLVSIIERKLVIVTAQ